MDNECEFITFDGKCDETFAEFWRTPKKGIFRVCFSHYQYLMELGEEYDEVARYADRLKLF
jgi:hypothetical protein